MKKYLLLNAMLVSFIISSSGFAVKGIEKKQRTKLTISELVNENNEYHDLNDDIADTIFNNTLAVSNRNSVSISELVNENNENPNLNYNNINAIFNNNNFNNLLDTFNGDDAVNSNEINQQEISTKKIEFMPIKFIPYDVKYVKTIRYNHTKTVKQFERYCMECGSVGTFTHTCIKANHKKFCDNCGKIHKKLIYKPCPYKKVNAKK